MRLRIDGCKDRKFIEYLVVFISNFIKYKTDYSKLINMEKYLNSLPEYTNEGKLTISCREILYLAASSLQIKVYQNHFEIYLDNNKKFHNIDAKLYDICSLINYGNLSIQGTGVFTAAMNFASENIGDIYTRYVRGFSA